MSELSHERLRELLNYDEITGMFTWKKRAAFCVEVGSEAGTVEKNGYRRIGICGRIYKAHRLAWFYAHGTWPVGEIDHINGDKLDNRIENLRDVPRLVNQQNQRRPRGKTASGILGVCWHPSTGKWRARVWDQHAKKNISLGLFENAQEARAAYINAKRLQHPGCTL